MTATATVQVSFVNPPRPGKKNWSIRCSDNQIYSVPSHLANFFQQRGTYQIEYEGHEYQGNYYKTVQKVTPVAAPVDNVVKGKFGQTDDKTAERIFVCGIINAAVESGQLNPADTTALTTVVNSARHVWAITFGNSAPPGMIQGGNPNMPTGGNISTGAAGQGQQFNPEVGDQIPW